MPSRSEEAPAGSVSLRMKAQLLPEKSSTLPLSKNGLVSSSQAPAAMSGVPSPLTSPAAATE